MRRFDDPPAWTLPTDSSNSRQRPTTSTPSFAASTATAGMTSSDRIRTRPREPHRPSEAAPAATARLRVRFRGALEVGAGRLGDGRADQDGSAARRPDRHLGAHDLGGMGPARNIEAGSVELDAVPDPRRAHGRPGDRHGARHAEGSRLAWAQDAARTSHTGTGSTANM